MDRSAEQPMKMPQSFPLNQQQIGMNNNNYGNPVQPIVTSAQPYPNFNQQQPVMMAPVQPQVVNVVNTQFGTRPVSITCQFCKLPITTHVEKSFSFCSCLLCIYCGFFFWICIQICRKKEINCCDATHTCPNCGQVLGTYTSC